MKPDELRKILDKYYEGESTEEEDLFLKRFFNSTDVPEEFLTEKKIFSYYHMASEIPEPSDDFETKIISAIDSLDSDKTEIISRKLYRILAGVAAVLLIVTGSYFFFINKAEPHDTYTDPEIAYEATLNILYNVSDRLNNGTKELDRISSIRKFTVESLKTIDKSTSQIREKMKPLGTLQKAMEQIDKNNKKN